MAQQFRWFHHRAPSRQAHSAIPAGRIEKALDRDSAIVSSQDPDTAAQWNLLRSRISSAPQHAQEQMRPTVVPWLKPAAAIGLAGAAIVVLVSILVFRSPVPVNYQTGDREQNTIVLADGSEVILNHNSAIAVNLKDADGGRRTDLTGEAFFKVHKTGTPFVVHTDIGSVQVLGTEFNVRVRRGMMEVAVVSGRVRVTASSEGKDSTVILHGGEITAVARGAYPERPRRLPFDDEYPGWIHGKFVFQQATLDSACLEIADQFSSPIAISNPALSHRTITGVVDGRNLESALKTLSLLSGTSYRHENSGYILY
jgi:transmembrane sensor